MWLTRPLTFDSSGFMCVLTSNRHQGLSDVDTSDGSLWFTVRTSHSGLQTICTRTRQHFVDTHNVEGMHTDTDVESVLTWNERSGIRKENNTKWNENG